MSNEQSSRATLRDNAFMRAFLDAVIPPSEDRKLPGAGALGLAGKVAEDLEGDATLGTAVEAGLSAVREAASGGEGGFAALSMREQMAAIEFQIAAHPMLMAGVTQYLYLAYYQHPSVLMGIGEPTRPRFPGGFEIEATDPALLELLLARGEGS
jgi:hypothetical protein